MSYSVDVRLQDLHLIYRFFIENYPAEVKKFKADSKSGEKDMLGIGGFFSLLNEYIPMGKSSKGLDFIQATFESEELLNKFLLTL